MITVDTPLLVNALLFGTTTILIFLFPYTYYFYKFLGERSQENSYVETIMKGVILHMVIVVALSFVLNVFDAVMLNPSMKPSNGIKYFYGYIDVNGNQSQGMKILWDYWLNQNIISTSSVQTGAQQLSATEKNTMLVWFQAVSVIVFAAMLFLPLAIIAGFFIIYFKQGYQEAQNGSALLQRISKAAMFYIVAFVLFYVHLLISSSFVNQVAKVDDFDFYKMLSSLWYGIIYG